MVNEIPFTCLPFDELFNIGSAFLWTLKENLSILLYAVWPWFLCAVRMCHIYQRKKIMMEYGKIEQHSILLFLITYNIRILNSAINIWYLEKAFFIYSFDLERKLLPHIIYIPDYFMNFYGIHYVVNLFVKTKTQFSQLVVTSIYGLYSYI